MSGYSGRPTRAVLLLVLLLGTGHAIADDDARVRREIAEQRAAYPSGADTVVGMLFRPEQARNLPGIVLIHEWWGLDEWVKLSARRLARAGYVVLAVDLYRGHVAEDADMAHQLMRALPEDQAARDLRSAVDFLRGRPDVDPERIASVGWCMGGGYSLQTAIEVPDLTACVVCYGRLVTEDASIEPIGAAILGIYGADDDGIPPQNVRKFESRARDLGKDVEMHIYEGAGHAFMNQFNQGGYNADATTQAWEVILEFLARTLTATQADPSD